MNSIPPGCPQDCYSEGKLNRAEIFWRETERRDSAGRNSSDTLDEPRDWLDPTVSSHLVVIQFSMLGTRPHVPGPCSLHPTERLLPFGGQRER